MSTYSDRHFLHVYMVEQVFCEEFDWVVGMLEVSLGKGLGENQSDVLLAQVFDVGVITSEHCFECFKSAHL